MSEICGASKLREPELNRICGVTPLKRDTLRIYETAGGPKRPVIVDK